MIWAAQMKYSRLFRCSPCRMSSIDHAKSKRLLIRKRQNSTIKMEIIWLCSPSMNSGKWMDAKTLGALTISYRLEPWSEPKMSGNKYLKSWTGSICQSFLPQNHWINTRTIPPVAWQRKTIPRLGRQSRLASSLTCVAKISKKVTRRWVTISKCSFIRRPRLAPSNPSGSYITSSSKQPRSTCEKWQQLIPNGSLR